MVILGINAFHPDSSACLLVDGKIKFAIEEERINRIKHWSGLPILSVKNCLLQTGISAKDIDFVAINSNFYANLFYKLKYLLLRCPDFDFLLKKIKNKNKKKNIVDLLNYLLDETLSKNCKLINIEHHKAHVSSAYFDSEFDNSVNLSIDGFGDFVSLTYGVSNKQDIKIDHKILFPHSLGIFYEACTQHLGFSNFGDEYKVMCLSSYGKPTELKNFQKIIYQKNQNNFNLNLNYFNHHKKDIFSMTEDSSPNQKKLFNDNVFKIIGKARKFDEPITEEHKNISASVQKIFEDILFNILNFLHKKYKIHNLTLSGGCAQNSLANGKITQNTPFKSVFIPSNPGDAGGAVGAAYSAWVKIKRKRPALNQNAYLGNKYSNEYIKRTIDKNNEILKENKFNIFFLEEDNLYDYIAKQIFESKIIGWFQGEMEWGPRALGNRSILADPRNPEIKNIINSKIKRRESFRPFAPSILADQAGNWLEDYFNEEPYMSKVFKFKKDRIDKIPGVVHIDGTGRIQAVSMNTNKRFYKLIKSFFNITNIPILLNTSFNENEPIVLDPQNAIDCFLRTNMDTLVLENWIINR